MAYWRITVCLLYTDNSPACLGMSCLIQWQYYLQYPPEACQFLVLIDAVFLYSFPGKYPKDTTLSNHTKNIHFYSLYYQTCCIWSFVQIAFSPCRGVRVPVLCRRRYGTQKTCIYHKYHAITTTPDKVYGTNAILNLLTDISLPSLPLPLQKQHCTGRWRIECKHQKCAPYIILLFVCLFLFC